jgi:hypothetical protein
MDDEQERELELEIEEEVQKERPAPAKPHKPHLDVKFHELLRGSATCLSLSFLLPITKAFESSTLKADELEEGPWSKKLRVTRDFVNTVVISPKDRFLRSPAHILTVWSHHGEKPKVKMVVVLSPLEANELLRYFYSSNRNNNFIFYSVTLDHIYPRTRKHHQDILYSARCIFHPKIFFQKEKRKR